MRNKLIIFFLLFFLYMCYNKNMTYKDDKNFISPVLSIQTLDTFIIRNAIFNFIKKNLSFFKGNLLDVGCGKMPYRNYILKNSKVEKYIGIDLKTAIHYDKNIKPSKYWNGKKLPCKDKSVDTVILTEVLEHCPDPISLLKEVHRVLKNDGYCFISTPFIWNLHEIPHDECRYTPFSLQKNLALAGFRNTNIYGGGGWHASLAMVLGLWARRGIKSPKKIKFISILLLPIIRHLVKIDSSPKNIYTETCLITNLLCRARK